MRRSGSACLIALCLVWCQAAGAAVPVRILFQKGQSGATWNGVTTGETLFKLNLGKGQTLTVGGDDVYTWHVVSPRGKKLGCEGVDYCVPNNPLVGLPESGDYTIHTEYRMSGCATCPAEKTRKVKVTFTAK